MSYDEVTVAFWVIALLIYLPLGYTAFNVLVRPIGRVYYDACIRETWWSAYYEEPFPKGEAIGWNFLAWILFALLLCIAGKVIAGGKGAAIAGLASPYIYLAMLNVAVGNSDVYAILEFPKQVIIVSIVLLIIIGVAFLAYATYTSRAKWPEDEELQPFLGIPTKSGEVKRAVFISKDGKTGKLVIDVGRRTVIDDVTIDDVAMLREKYRIDVEER